MTHDFQEVNLTTSEGLAKYQEIVDDPMNILVSEDGEFTRNGEYIVLLHYKRNDKPNYGKLAEPCKKHKVSIIYPSTEPGRKAASNIYSYHKVTKMVRSFLKGMHVMAIHWVESAGDGPDKVPIKIEI